MASETPVLEMRGITKRFPGIVANDAVDFDLRAGEVHALLGENGAGKSTLMNILYGLYTPDEGEIFVKGKPVRMESPREAIAQGSDIVFQVAGQCGLGALSAAKEKNVWGIGVDADQSYLGTHILTSALKKVDNAVFQSIQQANEGTFSGGEDTVFDVASGGVGLGKISPDVPAEIVSKVQAVQDDLAAGKITGIPDAVK